MLRFGLIFSWFSCVVFPVAAQEQFYLELESRYAPYAAWEPWFEEGADWPIAVEKWWKLPGEIRSTRSEGGLPLSGLHLALDPGHIGGEWAEAEGRHFKIDSDDFFVREGELVLEVARLVAAELTSQGARVTLLRENAAPVNPKRPEDYLEDALKRMSYPETGSYPSLADFALDLRREIVRRAIVFGEIAERARLINETIRPDAVLSLHINAAPWPKDEAGERVMELVQSNHTHVLIFGCMSGGELAVERQRRAMLTKIFNGSGPVEVELGEALGAALGDATRLPASGYSGNNAVRLEGHSAYLWARNLMLLRMVECPIVLLEPYVANSEGSYSRLQQAIAARTIGNPLAEDDILKEYAAGVIRGILKVYGTREAEVD
jgi:N-acetylmuramoyl-L-alanine amidase